MTDSWEDLALATSERFGGAFAHPATAAEIRAVWERAPTAVARAIDRVASDYEAGTVRSPWGILRARVAQIVDDQPKYARANDRDKAIARAEQWLRTAGVHYDRPSEIEQELFGSSRLEDDLDKDGRPITSYGNAILGAHADDRELRLRMVNLWREHRPVGELLEAQAIERGKLAQRLAQTLDRIRRTEDVDHTATVQEDNA